MKLRPRMRLGSTEAIKNAVMRGLGVAMVSRLTVALECQTGRLREVPVENLEIRRALYCPTLRGKAPSPGASGFLAEVARRYGRFAIDAGSARPATARA